MADYEKTVKKDESSLITHYALRRLAYPLTILAYKLGLTSNQVTLASGLGWLVTLVLFPLGGWLVIAGDTHTHYVAGWGLCLTSGFLWSFCAILDVVDGSLARLRGTGSPAGFYLDYVFHLLFKPGFLASIGMVASLVVAASLRCFSDSPLCFLPFVSVPLAPMLNWSASQSSAEHVLCELKGKGKLPKDVPSDIWLGASDTGHGYAVKMTSKLRMATALAAELFSYYFQYELFSITVLVDFLCELAFPKGWIPFLCTSVLYWLLFFVFLFRLPFRVMRDYRRMKDLSR